MIKPNKHIISLEPYSITEQDVWLGKDKSKILKLDWNEAPEDHEFLREELRNIINQKGILSWYPDYNCTEITKIVAQAEDIETDSISFFPGSDVAIETFARSYLLEDDKVLIVSPTYEHPIVYFKQFGSEISFFQKIKGKVSKVFFCQLVLIISQGSL